MPSWFYCIKFILHILIFTAPITSPASLASFLAVPNPFAFYLILTCEKVYTHYQAALVLGSVSLFYPEHLLSSMPLFKAHFFQQTFLNDLSIPII